MQSRGLLIILASLVAIAGYVWLHMKYLMGFPVMLDVPFVVFVISLPIFVLAVLVGATVLWLHTRHPAALLQFVSCCITFVLGAVELIGKFLNYGDRPQFSEFMRQPVLQFVVQIIVLLCFVAFLSGYIWYARTAKRI